MADTIPELVERFCDGDTSAFAELVDKFQKKIYYLAYRILGNHLDADEVVQETFVRVYHKRQELKHVASVSSFLIRVATNYSIDLLRKRKGPVQVSHDSSSLPGEVQVELARHVKTPGDLLDDKNLMTEIRRALATLPPRQQLTAILHDIEGYSKSEIAGILECPEATVRSNLHIARTKLKKILRKRLNKGE